VSTLAWCRRAADALLGAALAAPCLVCGTILDEPTHGAVCDACWNSVRPLTPPLCDACGDPLPTWRTLSVPLGLCPRCRRRPRIVERSRAAGAYEGALREIVHALKYDARRSLARPLAALMRSRAGDLLDGIRIVVPVPLHWSRRRQRGFDQAWDLARHLGLPVCRALRRVRATPTQTSLPAAQRHRNVRDAFAATRRSAMANGAIVLLVDDVSTTGATLDACARVLKACGAREVRALTAARAPTRPR